MHLRRPYMSSIRTVGAVSRTAGVLLALFCACEWTVLVVKLPTSGSWTLFGTILWSILVYGLVGASAGAIAGALMLVLVRASRGGLSFLTGARATWSLALSGVVGFYWVYSANMLYPGGSRDPLAIALAGAAVCGALALAFWMMKRLSRVPSGSEVLRWLALAVLVCWLPLYATSSGRGVDVIREGYQFTEMAAARDAPTDERLSNLLVIMMDTTRTDCMGCYGATESATPNVDRLASRGVVFEQCVAMEPLTRPMTCTLFTGLYPRTHGVDSNMKALEQEFTTLAEVLRHNGYSTGGFAAATVLSSYFGVDQGFGTYVEPSESWWVLRNYLAVKELYLSLSPWARREIESSADEINSSAIPWIRSHGHRPFFAFVQYFDPHYPYRPPDEFDFAARKGLEDLPEPYESRQDMFGPDFEMPADYLEMQWLRYRGEIAYADDRIGELMGVLSEMGIDDRTIVLLVADHGESFEHDYYFAHGNRLYDALVRVPLVLYAPGVLEPSRVKNQVRLIDVCPSVLDVLGLPPLTDVQGESFVELAGSRAARVELADHRPAMSQTDFGNPLPLSSRKSLSYRSPPWKLITSPEIGLVELYNLARDPEEKTNVARQFPEIVERLERGLREWDTETPKRDLAPVELPDDRRWALKTLGYLN